MDNVYLLLFYLHRAMSYYVEGRAGSLTEIAALEQGFFHDLKGIFNKRLGLPLTKYRNGDRDPRIKADIRQGATDLVARFGDQRTELFRVLPPQLELVRIFRLIARLSEILECGPFDGVPDLLDAVKSRSFALYEKQIKSSTFDLRELLGQIVATNMHSSDRPDQPVSVSLQVKGPSRSVRLPYSDFSTWRRLFENLVLNAVEAVQGTGRGGRVEVMFDAKGPDLIEVTVADTGVGMDEATLANFTSRGFTRGKLAGQGLGINEELVAFVNERGRFAARSTVGLGTTISVGVDLSRIVGAKTQSRWMTLGVQRRLRPAGLLIFLGILLFVGSRILVPDVPPALPEQIADYELRDTATFQPNSFYSVIARDRNQRELWQKTFAPNAIFQSLPLGRCDPTVKDVNQDGRSELVLTYGPHPMEEKGPGYRGAVVCLGDSGRTLWQYPLGPNPPRSVFEWDSIGLEGRYTPHWFGIVSSSGGSKIVTVAVSNQYPCQVLSLDGRGSLVGEYWHPGHLQILSLSRIDTLRHSINCWGINNRAGWSPVVMRLDVDRLSGQALPYLDPGLPAATEDCYYHFGHAWVDDPAAPDDTLTPYEKYGCSIESGDRRSWRDLASGIDRTGIQFTISDGRTIWFDDQLILDSIVVDTVLFSRWWYKQCRGAGVTRHWSAADTLELHGYRKYVRGELVEDNIKIHKERYSYDYWAPILRRSK